MFAKKLQLSDELINLITSTRKRYDITAYSLSSSIGKKPSWVPNIENGRVKTIAKDDLLALFKTFAEKENLRVEEYIVKHISPTAIIQLEDGSSVSCELLQKKLNLVTGEDNHIYDEMGESPDQVELMHFNIALDDLKNSFTDQFENSMPKERKEMFDVIDSMKDTITCSYPQVKKIYNQYVRPVNDLLGFDDNQISYFQKCFEEITNNYIASVKLYNKEVDLAEYFTSTGSHIFTHFGDINLSSSYSEIMDFILDIEKYFECVFSYAKAAYEVSITCHYQESIKVNYSKYLGKMIGCLHFLCKSLVLKYDFDFQLPKEDADLLEINTKQNEVNTIMLSIKQQISSRFKI